MLGMNLLEPWWTHGLPWKRGEQEWRTMGRNSGPENNRRNLAGRWFNEHLGLKAKKWPGCCSRFGDRNSWSYHSAVSLSRVSWLRTTPLHVNRGRRNHIWRRECMCVCKKQEDDFTEYGYEDWGWYSYLFMNMCECACINQHEGCVRRFQSHDRAHACVWEWNKVFEEYVSLKHMHEEPCIHKRVSLYVWFTCNFDST